MLENVWIIAVFLIVAAFVFIRYDIYRARVLGLVLHNYRKEVVSLLENEGHEDVKIQQFDLPKWGYWVILLKITLDGRELDVICHKNGKNKFLIDDMDTTTVNTSNEEIQRCLLELGLLKQENNS